MATMGLGAKPKEMKKPEAEGLKLLKEALDAPPSKGAALTAEKLAKVNKQRIANGKKRGPQALKLALRAVAKSLGMKPEEVKSSLGL